MDMRKQALDEERKRREELEKRLQEETNRRQKLIEREVKLREKQRVQVRGGNCWDSFVFLSVTGIIISIPPLHAALLLSPSKYATGGKQRAKHAGFYRFL